MRWIFLFFVILSSGCASRVVSLQHQAPLEVYVISSKSDWSLLTHLIFKSTDYSTIIQRGFHCTHELKRDLHQCYYLSRDPLEESCSQIQQKVQNILGSQLTSPLRSRCEVGPLHGNLFYKVPAALIFESRLNFNLTYNRVSLGTRCASGKISSSSGRGTCSWNGGVAGTAYTWILDGDRSGLRSAYASPSRFSK